MPMTRFPGRMLAAALLFLASAAGASAGTFPSPPIHPVVPHAPGGSTEAVARLLGQGLTGLQGFVAGARCLPRSPNIAVVGIGGTVHPTSDAYQLRTLEINPLVVMPAGRGVVVRDAVIETDAAQQDGRISP